MSVYFPKVCFQKVSGPSFHNWTKLAWLVASVSSELLQDFFCNQRQILFIVGRRQLVRSVSQLRWVRSALCSQPAPRNALYVFFTPI